MEPERTGLKRIVKAFGYSFEGLRATYASEAAFRQELWLCAGAIPIACWLDVTASERALLKEIDEALDRIKNNTFGICLGTGQPIGKPRLMARPWAKFCIDYARQVEKGLVRTEPPTGNTPEELEETDDETDRESELEVEGEAEPAEREVEEDTEE